MGASVPASAPGESDDWIDRFLDDLWMSRGVAANTIAAYRRDLAAFAGWLAPRPLHAAAAAAFSPISATAKRPATRPGRPRGRCRHCGPSIDSSSTVQ